MKKLNNKILIIVLVGLAAVFALSRVFRSTQWSSNARTELLIVDTASVIKVVMTPYVEKGNEVLLIKEGKSWRVKSGQREANTEQGSVNIALATFVKLKPLRLITKKKEKWNEYNVADSGTRVKIFKGEEVLADIYVGRVGFNQSPDGQFNAGGIFTYVRLADENEVFSVEGFLESTFNKRYNDWRDKAFLRLKKEMITSIQFYYPADSSFMLTKKEKGWWIGSERADSLKVNNYISQLELKNATTFADDYLPGRAAEVTIQLKGESGLLASVEGWRRANDWALKSSWQPTIYFSSDQAGLVKSLFESKKNMFKK